MEQFKIAREARLQQKKRLLDSYGSSFDGMLVFAIPVVAISVLSIFLMGHWPGRSKTGGETSSEEIISVITVLLLVCLILILALADKLEKEALGTLIGGIAAYVLGDSVRRRAADRGYGPRGDEDLSEKTRVKAATITGSSEEKE